MTEGRGRMDTKMGKCYRSQAFSGFGSPQFVNPHQQFNVALVPSKYVPKRHCDSLESRFGMCKPTHFGNSWKPSLKTGISQSAEPIQLSTKTEEVMTPPAEPAPPSSSVTNKNFDSAVSLYSTLPKIPIKATKYSHESPTSQGYHSIAGSIKEESMDLLSPSDNMGQLNKFRRFYTSTPKKLLYQNESSSSLGLSEFSFNPAAEEVQNTDTFIVSSGINVDSDFSSLQEQQPFLQVDDEQGDRIEKLEHDMEEIKRDLKVVSGMIAELAAAVRVYFQQLLADA